MTEVLIFGGTTEGRELAAYAASRGIPTLLSVVSEYGKRMMEEMRDLSVRCGALDEEGIFRLLIQENPRLVLDATHPHAAAATVQIREACRRAEIRCLRVLRETEESGAVTGDPSDRIFPVHTAQEAAEILARDREPVLLTTGSRELTVFASVPHLKGRIFARVLPDSQVLAECERMGISGRQLIAMQGPFSEEMNIAMLRAVDAGWLVTKESGSQGGFAEKLRAAEVCGVRTVVIQRPHQEPGISAEQAREELLRLAKKECVRGEEREAGEGDAVRELSLIGMGMGCGEQLTLEALEALKRCEVVLGAPRMLEDVKRWTEGKPRKSVYQGEAIWEWMKAHPEYTRIAVIYSGDTGFYSGCGSLLRALEEKQKKTGQKELGQRKPEQGSEVQEGREQDGEIRIRIYPGISTLSCLCSRLGKSWEDICPASLHGRACEVEQLLQEHPRVFLLLGGRENLGALCRRLEQAGLGDVQVSAGIRLGYPEEKILTGKARELCSDEEDFLAAVLLECV